MFATDPSQGVPRARPAPPFDAWRTTQVYTDVIAAGLTTPEGVAVRQTQRLQNLLRYASRHSRYYANLFAGVDPASVALADLPVSRKRGLMSAFDDWVTDPALDLAALREFAADPSKVADPFLGRYVIWESSGSTGEPAIFVQDAAAMAVYDALEAIRRPANRL